MTLLSGCGNACLLHATVAVVVPADGVPDPALCLDIFDRVTGAWQANPLSRSLFAGTSVRACLTPTVSDVVWCVSLRRRPSHLPQPDPRQHDADAGERLVLCVLLSSAERMLRVLSAPRRLAINAWRAAARMGTSCRAPAQGGSLTPTPCRRSSTPRCASWHAAAA